MPLVHQVLLGLRVKEVDEVGAEGKVDLRAVGDAGPVLGGQVGVEVYTEEGNKNPVQIAENAIKYARQNSFNVVIVDTAAVWPWTRR